MSEHIGSGCADDALPPWLEPTWRRLRQAHRRDRLGQALLISGPAGVGKHRLLEELIRLVLCGEPCPDDRPCGHCADCRLLDAGNHPDRVLVESDSASASGEIRADQVREVCSREGLTPTRGTSKVLVLHPAEAMNAFAANSLLKTLEEPVGSSIWILVSERPQRLPQTIRSRCQSIELSVPREQDALPWLSARLRDQAPQQQHDGRLCLRVAHGAPLRALDLALSGKLEARKTVMDGLAAIGKGQRDPIALAAEWQSFETADLIALMIDWVGDLLRLSADTDGTRLTNLDLQGVLEALAPRLDPPEGHRLLQHLYRAHGLSDAPLNKQLLLESLLVRWAVVVQRRP
ncbi:MAG: DNA polymerase III subunit delta' [Gammaproteobacteria bacterium]|jgi:DNA polymerase-3 subunit delta'|nr:DNA polymerase III subunit delta' [Gammaproteobacteria bacterium]